MLKGRTYCIHEIYIQPDIGVEGIETNFPRSAYPNIIIEVLYHYPERGYLSENS